jgi:glucose-6-phosphate isomerase
VSQQISVDIQDADLAAATTSVVDALVNDQVASKITAGDATLWGPAAEAESSIRLAWTTLHETSQPLLAEIAALRKELVSEGLTRIVLAGMGGSSLAPEVITKTDDVNLIILDTTDAGQVYDALDGDLSKTVLVVSSKSGGTAETDSHRRIFTQFFTDEGIDAASRIIVVTDPGSPFEKLSKDLGYRKVFIADPHVGGRYSALTAFGLVPAGLAGADIERLLSDAADASAILSKDEPSNPGLVLGAALAVQHAANAEKVVLADNGSGIKGFGDWAEQLIAESTGKDGLGLLPVAVEGITAAGFVDAKDDATTVALGRPAAGAHIVAAGSLGGQFLLWEYATAVASRVIGINPFDQPDVEAAKIAARALLDNPSIEIAPANFTAGVVEVHASGDWLPAGTTTLVGAVQAFIAAVPESGYFAVQAYLDRLADTSADLLRKLLAQGTARQTTFGWGPRFLHSTGQYHKGGHQNGGFLQITGAVEEDMAIPDRPYKLGFLQMAQALGDGNVLVEHGRPVLRLHLNDRIEGLAAVVAAVQEAVK